MDTITELDIDWDAELRAELAAEEELAEAREEYRREVAECCGGTSWTCSHYGHRS